MYLLKKQQMVDSLQSNVVFSLLQCWTSHDGIFQEDRLVFSRNTTVLNTRRYNLKQSKINLTADNT